jgi:hypothetical protein
LVTWLYSINGYALDACMHKYMFSFRMTHSPTFYALGFTQACNQPCPRFANYFSTQLCFSQQLTYKVWTFFFNGNGSGCLRLCIMWHRVTVWESFILCNTMYCPSDFHININTGKHIFSQYPQLKTMALSHLTVELALVLTEREAGRECSPYPSNGSSFWLLTQLWDDCYHKWKLNYLL